MSTILASSFKKQTQFLIPALLLASVPFWSFSDKTFAESSTLIFWYSFVMMLPVSVAFLLVIRRRLNNGQNIFFISKILRVLMYLVIFVFLWMLITGISSMYDIGLKTMIEFAYEMPLYILLNFIADILIPPLLYIAIQYNRRACGLNYSWSWRKIVVFKNI